MKTGPGAMVSSGELTPEEVLWRMIQCDHLYVAGKQLAWMGLRHDHPDATEEELEQHWEQMLENRRRDKWGVK